MRRPAERLRGGWARLPALLALAAITAATVGGCGGGSSENQGVTEISSAAYPNGHDTDEVSASGAKPIKPCGLVSKAEAKAILGTGVSVAERLQGPTCSYTGSGRQVTLVVGRVSLRSLRGAARGATPVKITGRPGWCLRYEATSVVVAAGEDRVLQVTGPCAAGVRFAALALPRIPG
jgi:hypothetical protein